MAQADLPGNLMLLDEQSALSRELRSATPRSNLAGQWRALGTLQARAPTRIGTDLRARSLRLGLPDGGPGSGPEIAGGGSGAGLAPGHPGGWFGKTRFDSECGSGLGLLGPGADAADLRPMRARAPLGWGPGAAASARGGAGGPLLARLEDVTRWMRDTAKNRMTSKRGGSTGEWGGLQLGGRRQAERWRRWRRWRRLVCGFQQPGPEARPAGPATSPNPEPDFGRPSNA